MGRHTPEPDTQPLRIVRPRKHWFKRVVFGIARYSKFIVAAVGAVGSYLAPLYIGDGLIDLPEKAQFVVSVLVALGVITVPNKKKEM
jgi:hypothetical protein